MSDGVAKGWLWRHTQLLLTYHFTLCFHLATWKGYYCVTYSLDPPWVSCEMQLLVSIELKIFAIYIKPTPQLFDYSFDMATNLAAKILKRAALLVSG